MTTRRAAKLLAGKAKHRKGVMVNEIVARTPENRAMMAGARALAGPRPGRSRIRMTGRPETTAIRAGAIPPATVAIPQATRATAGID